MTILLGLLGLIGPIAIIIALLVMASLSQRLGAVTRRTPLYRWFYISAVFVMGGLIWRFLTLVAPDIFGHQNPLLYDIPLAVGLVIALVVAWRYWSWLLSERGTGSKP
jgi:hypothetical protein